MTENSGITSPNESKNTKDIALASAKLAISLASICLVLLAITVPNKSPEAFVVPLQARIALILIGTGLLLSSALLIDWVIDNFSEADWYQVLGKPTNIDKLDQFPVRARLYNGGYLILSLGIAFIGGTILSLTPYHLQRDIPGAEMFFYVASIVFSGYVFIQMMTNKLGRRIYAIVAFVLIVGIVIGANIR